MTPHRPIENSASEHVGEINDLVIDAREREIRYVAVTYGGFLGIGNELHAVPFEAFQFKADPDDPADTVLVLNVTQEEMKGAKQFDENKWPHSRVLRSMAQSEASRALVGMGIPEYAASVTWLRERQETTRRESC